MHIVAFALSRCCLQALMNTFDGKLNGLFTFMNLYGTFHAVCVGFRIKLMVTVAESPSHLISSCTVGGNENLLNRAIESIIQVCALLHLFYITDIYHLILS